MDSGKLSEANGKRSSRSGIAESETAKKAKTSKYYLMEGEK